MMTLILSLALAAAAAETPPADGATTAQPAKPEKPKKICKATKMTGSSIGRRVCKTQEQWDNIARDGAQSLDLVDQGYKTNTGNGAVN
ncbi:hypothetical protein EEB18_000725 [Sphingopyxis sp. OPL5]|uniref:hypothetical protein n=1 Tax=Sphingopyxis sp. OPL5 TaxID=2486273 RepID=UPI00164DFC61|nr:hypothetical protein [Sphingopyxis sp. OPL5]QNO27557.1 hypothetical protein EEB18_000725 [Sphingopyxis sp. OPL5]